MIHARRIREVHGNLLALVRNLSAEEVTVRPNSSSWNILECLEHIFITNLGIYRFVTSPETTAAQAEVAELIPGTRMQDGLRDRTRKYIAPERVRPVGRFSSLPLAVEKIEWLDKQFESHWARRIPLDHAIMDHPILGAMTKTDWLNFLVGHTERHARQIEELLSNGRKLPLGNRLES